MKTQRFKETLTAYLFIFPNYVIYLTFTIFPMIWVLYFAFTNFNIFTYKFIGLKNFRIAFQDEVFLQSVVNTLIYTLGTVVPQMAGGLLIAVFLNLKAIKMRYFIRLSIFLPYIISTVALSFTWLYILDTHSGPLNLLLGTFGIPKIGWLSDIKTALFSVSVTGIWWRLGFNMIVYLAGLQNIPDELIEAAKIDGASEVSTFFRVILPLLKPITFFLLVMNTIASFQIFAQVFIMTQGGPINSTTTVVHQIYLNTFQGFKLGYASALSVLLLLAILAITFLNFMISGRDYAEHE